MLARLLLVAALAASACSVFTAFKFVSRARDNAGESTPVYMAYLTSRTGHVYASLDAPPYTPANYGPAYYLSLGGIGRLFNADFERLRMLGRVVMFACFLAAVAVVWRWRGALAGALVLGEIGFVEWNTSGRPDMAAILCNVGGLWMLASGRVAMAGALGGIALLFKQSYIALLAAGAIWLVKTRRYADLRRFLLAALAPVALVFGVLAFRESDIVTHLTAHEHTVDPAGMLNLLWADFRGFPHHAVLLGLAVFGIVRSAKDEALPALYFGAAWTIAMIALLPIGADSNYLLEGWLAAALLVPAALRHLNSRAAQACVLTLALGSAMMEVRPWRYAMARPDKAGEFQQLAELVRGREVFSSRPDIAALSRSPEMLDAFPARQLVRTGRWAEPPVLPKIRRQQYEFVMASEGGYRGQAAISEPVWRAIRQHYQPWRTIDGITVFIKKLDSDLP